MRTEKILVSAGIIGPLLYTVVLGIAGWLRPGYNHIITYMSELGVGANGWLMNILGFSLLGIMIIIFSTGLYMNYGKNQKMVVSLLAGSGLGMIGIGTFSGPIHSISVGVYAAPMLTAILLFSMTANKNMHTYSIITGIITAIFYVLTLVPSDYAGLMQRVALAAPLLWMMVVTVIDFNS
jgi:hypothetical membrane protein